MTLDPAQLQPFADALALPMATIQGAIDGELHAGTTVLKTAAVKVDDKAFIDAVAGLPDDVKAKLRAKIDSFSVKILLGHGVQAKLLALL